MRRLALRSIAGAAPALLAVSCAPPSDERPPRTFVSAPETATSSLLLVSLDTFRGDAAGSGGDPLARTPYLDRLGRTGIQFETGLAPTPLTLPSHTSLLTGHDPPAHGVRDNGTFRLRPGVPTLAEALHERGFATGAFVSAFPLAERFGLDRGFDVYDDRIGERGELGTFMMDQRDGAHVTEAARVWLASLPAGRRRFAFVHLFDAHTPWTAPKELVRATGGDGYLADVSLADRWLGRAVEIAREDGPCWVIVVGDHGESRGDHGESTHGLFLYESTVRVPAVVWPAPAGERPGLRRATLRLIDMPATAMALLGFAPEDAPGDGIRAIGAEPAPAYFESFYPFYHYGWSALRALRDGDWKLVSAPRPELYDLAADPGETRNVAEEHPDRVAAMADLLEAASVSTVQSVPDELDEESRAALESLGYVTRPTEAPDVPMSELPDPKAMIRIQSAIERAQAALAEGQAEAAIFVLRDAIQRDPRNKDVHFLTGLAHAMANRNDRAVDSFRRALDLPPHDNDRVPRFELASAYLRLGEPGKAAEQLQEITEREPDDPIAWYHLGLAREQLGSPEGAREAWEAAIRADPAFEPARTALER